MEGLALFLFVLGVLFIYCGWKAGNGNEQDKELYAVLLAMSKVKAKVTQLEKDYQTLAEKVERQHLWQAEIAGFREELDSLKQAVDCQLSQAGAVAQSLAGEEAQAAASAEGAPAAEILPEEESARGRENNVYSLEWFRGQGSGPNEEAKELPKEKIADKYRRAIVLAQSGMSVSQVAEKLDISQDAINMLLRTYQIGGRR